MLALHAGCVYPPHKLGADVEPRMESIVNQLLTILRAVHCRSTHHYFALDGLEYVRTEPGRRLRSLLLKHHDRYLTGAKDPDDSFKDFENHVLHVADKMWGGAIQAANTWHGKLVIQIRQENWRAAAYAAGVLSHYFTDPFMPLHTAQSPREAAIHRPLEWSVCKSYQTIFEHWNNGPKQVEPMDAEPTEQWLGSMIEQGATSSRQHYERLLEIYDLASATQPPNMGLNSEVIEIFSQLFGRVLTAWGQVLDRTAAMISAEIPDMGLTLATVLATIDVPLMWIVRRAGSVSEQRAVRSILAEYQAHGNLERFLPRECRVVASCKQRELGTSATESAGHASTPATADPPTSLLQNSPPSSHDIPQAISTPVESPLEVQPVNAISANSDLMTSNALPLPQSDHRDRGHRRRLRPESPVIDAPSIGVKTALRLAEAGVHTVEHLLRVHPAVLASRLDSNWITSDLIRAWQAQADLACRITNLRSVDAQLLTLVGIKELSDIARFDAESLHAVIYQQSQTSAGQRILRESSPPELERIRRWIEEVNSASRAA